MPCRNTSTGPLPSSARTGVEARRGRPRSSDRGPARAAAALRRGRPTKSVISSSMSMPTHLQRLDRPAAQPTGWPGRSSAPTGSEWCRAACARAARVRAEIARHVLDAAPDPQPVLQLDLDDVVRLQPLERQPAAPPARAVCTRAASLMHDRARRAARARARTARDCDRAVPLTFSVAIARVSCCVRRVRPCG